MSQTTTQSHLFIIDPIEKLNFKLDSSIRLAFELHKFGSKVYVTEDTKMFWNLGEPSAGCHASQVSFPEGDPASIAFTEHKPIALSHFHGIHMRKEPPFDIGYIGCTWLLDSASKTSWVFNNPAALRSINEKMSLFLFPQYAKEGLLSSNSKELLKFIQQKANGDAIIKPLDLFGGKGIFRINLKEIGERQALALLDESTNNSAEPRLIQPFNPEIHNGEVRVFTAGGKPISWCLKKPTAGNFMANTSQGATLEQFDPPKEMVDMVTDIAQSLLQQGIFITGFDIIGDAVSEINVTSPRLLKAENDQANYYKPVAEYLYQKCTSRP